MARVDIILTVEADQPGAERSLESVLAQTMRDWRVLAVIGAGTAGVRSVLEGRDERVEIIESGRVGAAGLRNDALSRVSAGYVCFLEAGDELAATGLSHLLSAAEGGMHGAAVGSWLVMNVDGSADGPPIDPPEGTIGLERMTELLSVPAAAALVGSSVLSGRRFGANLGSWSHTDLWLRLCEEGVRWQVTPSVVALTPHDRVGEGARSLDVEELGSVIERSFRRASAKGWEDERLDEAHEAAAVRSALFCLATRVALSGGQSDASRAAESYGRVATERCVSPSLLAEATAVGLRYSPRLLARIDGQSERGWARPVHEWWSRCVTQKWIARHSLDGAMSILAGLLIDPREVARSLLDGFGSPGRIWIGGTDRSARAVIGEALDAGWRVLVLPGRAESGVNQRLMALPSRVMVAAADEGIGTGDPLVIGSADETDLLERYGGRPNVARWNGAWRSALERATRRLESAWPRREP